VRQGSAGECRVGSPRDWLGTTWDQTGAQESELHGGFAQLAEFGATANAGLASRARWTRFNRMLAELHAIPWGIWSLAPTFAIYDPSARVFNPQLLAALMG